MPSLPTISTIEPLPAVKKAPVEPVDDTKSALKEMLLPIMLSGFGNMGAGMVLERVQFMDIFMAIPQLIQLVPPLLGLKGNVEMTLASRLSTHANLGHFSDVPTRRRIIVGNIALCQFLATGVGFIAPIISLLLSHIQFSVAPETALNPSTSTVPGSIPGIVSEPLLSSGSMADHLKATSLSASSMVQFDIEPNPNDFGSPLLAKGILISAIFLATSGLADIILSSTITAVVFISSQVLGINADNVATPIAASVGDLMTMCFLVYVAKGLYNLSLIAAWTPMIPLLLWTVILICTGIIARRNSFTRSKVFHGWTPLVVAMLLQNVSGIVMETSLRRFPKMAIYQPIINGFGGNLVAIQSSRVATYLHKHAPKRELVNETDSCCHSPLFFFCGDGQHGRLAFLMVLLAGPIQLPLVLISTLLSATSQITFAQLLTYYVCATIQVIIILYIGYCFVNLLWLLGANPDDNAIPILTALADLLGTIVLVSGYMFLSSIGDVNASHFDEGLLPTKSIASIVYNATSLNITNGTTILSPSSGPSIELTNITSILSTTMAPFSVTNKLASSLIANLTTLAPINIPI